MKIKKKINLNKKAGFILLFVLGLLILLYPTISNSWNAYRNKRLISNYTSIVNESGMKKKEDEILEKAKEYNKTLLGSVVPDAFASKDGKKDKEYEEILNIGNEGIMGYVEVPSVKISLPIYHYTTEEALEKGAGHLLGSSLPVGGESTHSVLTAHRGLPGAKLFTDLDRVKVSDEIYLHILGQIYAYKIKEIITVLPSETEALQIHDGEDEISLVTCTPYGVNSHRIIVTGKRIPYNEESYIEAEKKITHSVNNRIIMQILCGVIGAILGIVIVKLLNVRKLKKEKKHEED